MFLFSEIAATVARPCLIEHATATESKVPGKQNTQITQQKKRPTPGASLFIVVLLFLSLKSCGIGELCFSFYNNRYDTAVAVATLEDNSTISESIEGVVATHTYVLARVMNGTTLTNDDVASLAGLSTPNLNA